MREYEVTVVYDLALGESEGREAPVQRLTTMVENLGGEVTAVDHWGRRRLAYPIRHKIDGEYLIARVRLDPGKVRPLEHALRIDEQVYRFLVVRAEELPPLSVKAPAAPPAEARAAGPAEVSAPAPAEGTAPAPAQSVAPEPLPGEEPPRDEAGTTDDTSGAEGEDPTP